MPRSLKKGPFVHKSLLKKVQANLDSNKKNVIKDVRINFLSIIYHS